MARPQTSRPFQDRCSDCPGAYGRSPGRRRHDRRRGGRGARILALRDDLGRESARAGQHFPPAHRRAAEPEFLLPHGGGCRRGPRSRVAQTARGLLQRTRA